MENKKLNGDLIIEITRKCNLTCEHCLRGDMQDKEINSHHMYETIEQFEYINHVTFSGGEPSLNPQAITDFITFCKDNNIGVGSFYIATNAKHASDDFMLAVLNLYLYCDDNDEMSALEISNDYYHSNEPETVEKLRAFKFTRLKYSGNIDRNPRNMINQGYYADNYGDGRENEKQDFGYLCYDSFVDNGNLGEIQLYLNCDGQIVLGCDWSFENQKDNILCNSRDSIFKTLKPLIKEGTNE